ncbi:C6 finger domain protein, partial [Aspergillus sclerotialis]
MFKYQSHSALGHPPMSELEHLALEQCRLIETIERCPERESGCIISFKNSFAVSSLFLPKDERHIMWCRRKFALMEQNGYLHPPKLRAGLAAIWQVPDINT